ncbi:phosphoethanolamine transferase [Vibrio rumoiensis]|uniref:Phosphoethanolamine transferase n=1 Tax=Vibrio rumoiensis TaxID=76258 RepID=A0ABW7J1G0_9VIBR|nr:phosphoethanolamine--lipid A transferase [Vibrio rumoiensis]
MLTFISRLCGSDSFYRPSVKVTTLVVWLAFYYGFILNFPIVAKIFSLSQDVPDFWFPYTAPFVLLFAFIVIFSIFALPIILKPFFIILTLTSALALYAEHEFHVLFDTSMIENVIETNVSEILFYFNVRSVLYLLGFGVIPSLLLLWVKIEYRPSIFREVAARVILVLVALVGISVIAITTYKDYASVGRNNKYLNRMIIPAHVYDAYKYLRRNYLTKPLPYQSLGDDAKLMPTENGKPTLVVMVLGETARAMNFTDNGYARDTQPYTKDLGLISFKDVSSCGTYTALSVPCMFSNMNRTQYNKAKANAQDNAVDIIAKAGVETLWVDNDGGDKGVAHHTQLINIDPGSDETLCDGNTCFDQVMIKPAKQFIEKDHKNKLVVLHAIGSHGPTYFQRFPVEMAKFAPWCNRKDIEQCTDQEITNVYDNTLVYTDFFLAQVIEQLKGYSKDYNVALMYVSDHGESLGENGLYLHGTPYAIAPKEQTTVPWLLWLPEQYAQQKHIDAACVKQEAQQPNYSHDNFFHSLIGLYGVETKDKQADLDLFSNCHR